MKFGAHALIWSAAIDRDLFARFPAIREHGFDGVEMLIIRPEDVPVAEVRRSLADTGLECTFSAILPPPLSLVDEDAAIRRKATAHIAESVRVAAEAGAQIVAGPLYSPVGCFTGHRRTAAEWQRAVECYQSLGDTLRAHGVTLALEPLNRFETYFLNTAADAARLAAEVGHPNVGILFDTFHANIEERNVAGALSAVGPHLKHFHSSETDRGIPGAGHTDWPAVFRALAGLRYDGWVTIESFGFALGELSAAASIWRDLAPSAEAIPFEGVQFLKRVSQSVERLP